MILPQLCLLQGCLLLKKLYPYSGALCVLSHSCTYSLAHSLACPHCRLHTHSLVYPLTHSLTHLLTLSFTCAYSLTHSLNHSHTQPIDHSVHLSHSPHCPPHNILPSQPQLPLRVERQVVTVVGVALRERNKLCTVCFLVYLREWEQRLEGEIEMMEWAGGLRRGYTRNQ